MNKTVVLNDITFKKTLNEIVEKYVNSARKQSKATSIDELVKDESTIARLNRIYDTKDLLTDLYDSYEEDAELKVKIEQYSLDEIFAEMNSINNYYIDYYYSGDDDWLARIIDDLNRDFKLK